MKSAPGSCFYEGRVTHHRTEPVDHQFTYDVSMVMIDLDEWESANNLLHTSLSARFGMSRFLRSDHFGATDRSLSDCVRELVREQTGTPCRGSIKLLTQLRHVGYYFSPLNLFYCFAENGRCLESVVAEVTNTPWNERICYVLGDHNRQADATRRTTVEADATRSSLPRYRHPKLMHVSPFMPMNVEYDWTVGTPGDRLKVCLENLQEGERVFAAGFDLKRRAFSNSELRRAQLRFPLMTTRIIFAIYWQAMKLWWKKCPTYRHPSKRPETKAALPSSATASNLPTP